MLIIPSPIDGCIGYDWQIDDQIFPDYNPGFLTTVLSTMATKQGLSPVNLFEMYHGEDCQKLCCHRGNNHWTLNGQKLAATIVADHLLWEGRDLLLCSLRSSTSANGPLL